MVSLRENRALFLNNSTKYRAFLEKGLEIEESMKSFVNFFSNIKINVRMIRKNFCDANRETKN
jgi:hypothetical protein